MDSMHEGRLPAWGRRGWRRWILALGLALAAMPAAGYAQDAGSGASMSLEEAARRALAVHPRVEVAVESRAAAAHGTVRAEAERRPLLSLRGSATRYGEPMLVAPLHGLDPGAGPAFDDRLVQAAVTASYTLFDGGARGATITQARAAERAAGAGARIARSTVLRDVTRAYLDVLSRREVLTAHDRRLAALDAELVRTRQLFDEGRSARIEVLRAEAERGQAAADRVQAETRLRVATRSLARMIGYPEAGLEPEQLRPVALDGSALAPRAEALAAALRSNPEVQQAREGLAAAEASVRLAASRRRPEVKLHGGFARYGGFDADFVGEWSAGATLSLPLVDGGAIRAATGRARAEAGASEARLRLTELHVRDAIDRAAAAVEEADARVESLTATVRQLEEVVRVERLALESGTGTQTDYLYAEASLLSARASLAEARAAAIAARAELAHATGELSLDWLNHTLEMKP